MEEMNKELMENTVTEIVEGATDKLTFGETCFSYGIAAVFTVGVATVTYFTGKGVMKLSKKLMSKKVKSEEPEQEVVDVEEDDIHETENNETEQD